RRTRRAGAGGGCLLRGHPRVAGHAGAAADDSRVRAAARALPAADRGQPDGSACGRVRALGRPARVLPAFRRPGRAARARGRPSTADTHRRAHRARRRPLRAGRHGGARCARIGALGRVHAAAPSIPHSTRAGRARTVTTAQAYAEVERLTRRRARNFAYGIMVLPREKRRAIAAVYAFARRIDDNAAGALPLVAERALLGVLAAGLNEERDDVM